MKFIRKIINKIKDNKSYNEKNKTLLIEIKELISEVDRLETYAKELENKLDTDTQALIIDRLENTVSGQRETIKKLRESDNKRMRKNIELKEINRDNESKIKKLEQDLRIARKVGV